VVASTSEVYGSAQTIPIREDHPLNPQSPYAASKVAADSLALSFWRSFGLRVKVLRPFNTFGPRQSPRAVIPTIIHQIQSGSATVHLGRIDTTRDFTFVRDTARAFRDSLMSDECVGSVTNIGSSFEISIGDLALTIGQLMHADVSITSEETRLRPTSSEVVRLFASNDLARERIGWVPQFAGEEGFRRGLLATIEWIQGQERLELEYKK